MLVKRENKFLVVCGSRIYFLDGKREPLILLPSRTPTVFLGTSSTASHRSQTQPPVQLALVKLNIFLVLSLRASKSSGKGDVVEENAKAFQFLLTCRRASTFGLKTMLNLPIRCTPSKADAYGRSSFRIPTCVSFSSQIPKTADVWRSGRKNKPSKRLNSGNSGRRLRYATRTNRLRNQNIHH